MFCSDCGASAAGKYCWKCGAPLAASDGHSSAQRVISAEIIDWTTVVHYETLIGLPAVRDRLARAAANAAQCLSGEDFLAVCDKVLSPLTAGVPLSTIATLVQPVSERLGIKTGKQRSERLTLPTGLVIVGVLCSFAEHGQRLQQVHQAPDGCSLRASLPSDIWSLRGSLVVEIHRDRGMTRLDAVTVIPGQWFDWGKSRRCLEQLFDDLPRLARVA